jgi:ferredoxin-NADP reductase
MAIDWQLATVTGVRDETPTVRSFTLGLPAWAGHRPGQHLDLRLTAEDGYSASRSYSVASAPHEELLEFYVERLDDGEVSPYLAEDVEVGDRLQLRGPIGGWFVWDGSGPAVGIGGGTGVVPLVSMLRHARHQGAGNRLRLAAVGRTLAELPYADELTASGVTVALTREEASTGRAAGRLASVDVQSLVDRKATYYICGSPGFADSASRLLTEDLGVPPGAIRIERFGPTG